MTSRHTYPEAAAILRVEETWLRRHIKKLPHTKLGRVVTFSDADLDRITTLFHHEPTIGPLAAAPVPTPVDATHPLAHLRPVPSRRRRRSA
ncbi:helix-turn-helix domain-containing protein [Streptomyces sp. NPDC047024]|uniref:helix-turn-helix domain-containing protein n=1 Tax=Streptomyces sp. NPDC047024 TaxID=3155476 RepID=UPI0033D64542